MHDRTFPSSLRRGPSRPPALFSRQAPETRRRSVAIVGGGPAAVYLLLHLAASPVPLGIVIFERDREIGPGMPYRDQLNSEEMLSNIASREIPPVTETLLGFLSRCDTATRAEFGLAPDSLHEDAFFPRLVLGRYFVAQLAALVARARGRGHVVEVRSRVTVTDVIPGPKGTRLEWRSPSGSETALFDHAVIATGHRWSDHRLPSGVTLHTPWPAKSLGRFIGRQVGVLGTSLSAIDAVLGLAAVHGAFEETDRDVRWVPSDAAEGFGITMMSRRGLLPDPDWYYPLPLPDLPRFTEDAIAAEIAKCGEGLLDRCQSLLARDLADLDPAYAARVEPARTEGFADRHFAERMAGSPWDVARRDLARADLQRRARQTDPWRLALLRAHEVYEAVVPRLAEDDRAIFDRDLKPVFTDVYASVPHRSIRRMLALHDAGHLEILRLGPEYEIAPERRGARVAGAGGTVHVGAIVDARGQRPAGLPELGFPSLAGESEFDPDTLEIRTNGAACGAIFCLAAPILLPDHPFVQGLTRTAELARATVERLLGQPHARPET